MRVSLLILATVGLCLLGALPTAHARLGETRDQCHRRYGQPLETRPLVGLFEDAMETYRLDGFEIAVAFRRGVAATICYRHAADHLAPTDTEAEIMLTRNSHGEKWIQTATGCWQRADGEATAVHLSERWLLVELSPMGRLAVEITEDAAARQQAIGRANQRLQGF